MGKRIRGMRQAKSGTIDRDDAEMIEGLWSLILQRRPYGGAREEKGGVN